MELTPECVPCLLRRIVFECRAAGVSPYRTLEVLAECSALMGERVRPGMCSLELATPVHRLAKSMLGDPYASLKEKAWAAAEALLPFAERAVSESHDSLLTAALISVAGNILDFGAPDIHDPEKDLATMLEKVLEHGLDVNDLGTLRKWVTGSRVLFFTDNAGESLLDIPFLRQLREMAGEIVLVPKGGNTLSDTTYEEVYAHGLHRYADQVLSTGSDAVGYLPGELSGPLRELMSDSVVVAKGMAMAEGLTHWHRGKVCLILRAKCKAVASVIGAELGDNVVRCLRL